MHTTPHLINTPPPAPRNGSYENVARTHLEAAQKAAGLVRCQYSRQSKNQLIRQCLHNLQAFLAAPASRGGP